jgi:hypothetical protein
VGGAICRAFDLGLSAKSDSETVAVRIAAMHFIEINQRNGKETSACRPGGGLKDRHWPNTAKFFNESRARFDAFFLRRMIVELR